MEPNKIVARGDGAQRRDRRHRDEPDAEEIARLKRELVRDGRSPGGLRRCREYVDAHRSEMAPEVAAEMYEGRLAIGMTMEQARVTLGEVCDDDRLWHRTRSVSELGELVQWTIAVPGRMHANLTFTNGKLTSMHADVEPLRERRR